MANPNKIRSQDVDWSAGTSWSSSKFLKGDGTWDTTPAIPVANTVYVSKSGNDTTALAERMDKPSLTLANAKDLAYALTPSATKRIKIVVEAGTYTEKIVLGNYIDWDLGNSIIDLQAGAYYTIDDSRIETCGTTDTTTNVTSSGLFRSSDVGASISGTGISGGTTISAFVDSSNITISAPATATGSASLTISRACDSIIYGNGQILRSTAGTLGCIRTQNASTNLRLYADYISSSISNPIVCTNGTQYIFAKNGISGVGYCQVTGGSQTIEANISSTSGPAAVYVLNGGTQVIKGNVSSTSGAAALVSTSGTQTVYGNCTSSASSAVAIAVGGTQIIYGNCSNTGGSGLGASHSAGTQIIYGDCTSTTNAGADGTGVGQRIVNGRIVTTASNTNAYGNDGVVTSGAILDGCTLIATGTGKSIGDDHTVLIYGDCVGNKPLGTAITQIGDLKINSAVV